MGPWPRQNQYPNFEAAGSAGYLELLQAVRWPAGPAFPSGTNLLQGMRSLGAGRAVCWDWSWLWVGSKGDTEHLLISLQMASGELAS